MSSGTSTGPHLSTLPPVDARSSTGHGRPGASRSNPIRVGPTRVVPTGWPRSAGPDSGGLGHRIGPGQVSASESAMRPTSDHPSRSGIRGPWLDALSAALGGRAKKGVPLGPLTTYGVGGTAALFMEVEGPEDLDALRTACGAAAVSAQADRRISSGGRAPRLRDRPRLQRAGRRFRFRWSGPAARVGVFHASNFPSGVLRRAGRVRPSSAPAPPSPCPSWPAGPRTPGGGVCRGRSACPARSGARCG